MDPIEAFLRESLGSHPHDLNAHASRSLRIDATEVQRVLSRLIALGEVEELDVKGQRQLRWKAAFRGPVGPQLSEDRVWTQVIAPRVADAPDNVQRILHYASTEMINNVLDHSEAREIVIVVRTLPAEIEVYIEDDGVGIFEKLQREKGLEDPRHVALELAKGKMTTDPSRHTGEGIFFTAKMCDKFLLWSGKTACGHVDEGIWHVQEVEPRAGTAARLTVRLDTTRTPETVFADYAPPGLDYGFAHTEIPASLVGRELVSRSQAKRLLARCEQFQEVTLDFKDVAGISPAFADEAFRVWPAQHPGVLVRHSRANEVVLARIERVLRNGERPA